jgi:hypothetical protein
MNIGIAVAASLFLSFSSVDAHGRDLSGRYLRIDKEGGVIEVEATAGDRETRDGIRRQLSQEAHNGFPPATPAMRQHEKEIQYRYEDMPRGGRIRIIARTHEALSAVQDFFHSQMSPSYASRLSFQFAANSLVVVPVTINGSGPYRFILDTGASNTLLSAAIADTLRIPKQGDATLLIASGRLPVTIRTVSVLNVGAAHLDNIEVTVADFALLKTLNVEGVLGADYLRRFKVSIDYNNQTVDLEPASA